MIEGYKMPEDATGCRTYSEQGNWVSAIVELSERMNGKLIGIFFEPVVARLC